MFNSIGPWFPGQILPLVWLSFIFCQRDCSFQRLTRPNVFIRHRRRRTLVYSMYSRWLKRCPRCWPCCCRSLLLEHLLLLLLLMMLQPVTMSPSYDDCCCPVKPSASPAVHLTVVVPQAGLLDRDEVIFDSGVVAAFVWHRLWRWRRRRRCCGWRWSQPAEIVSWTVRRRRHAGAVFSVAGTWRLRRITWKVISFYSSVRVVCE